MEDGCTRAGIIHGKVCSSVKIGSEHAVALGPSLISEVA
jgi:hypothetical protein